MYIKSIHIKNYRSHKDTFIDFSNGVNLIIGGNDCGKSNILRAITQVIKNRPSGDDFISHWGNDMSVRIDFDSKAVLRYKDVINDHKTKDFKAGLKNFYILVNKENQSEKQIKEDLKESIKESKNIGCVEIFKAFGQGIPEKIKQVLNMGNINLAPQFDGPFLLTKSAPDVAKFYNGIVNLDIIDSSISNISKRLKREEKSLKIEKMKNEEKNEELKDFEWIDDAEKEIKDCEKIQQGIKVLKNDWTELFQLNKELKKLQEENDSINKITKHESSVLELIDLNNEYKKEEILFTELENLANNLISLNNKDDELKKVISFESEIDLLISLNESIQKDKEDYESLKLLHSDLKNIKSQEKDINRILKFENDTNDLILLDEEIKQGNDTYNELFDLSEDLNGCYESIIICEDELAELENELKEIWPDICPLCDNEIKK